MHTAYGVKMTWVPVPAPPLTSFGVSYMHGRAYTTSTNSWTLSETLGLLCGLDLGDCEQAPIPSKAQIPYLLQSKNNNKNYFSEN